MFRNRNNYISGLIDLHKRLESSNIYSLLENPTSINEDIETIREFLRTEIESFSTYIIDGLLDLTKTIDIQFAEKIIEFDPIFFGKILEKSISKYYFEVGFDNLFQIVSKIKNLNSTIDSIEALYNKIIVDGEKHRNEACELTTKLKEITSSEDFDGLSPDKMIRITNMIEHLKPHARPIVKKMFYERGMPLKKGEENGLSYPIFSQSGSWIEHELLRSAIASSFKETQDKFKKKLQK